MAGRASTSTSTTHFSTLHTKTVTQTTAAVPTSSTSQGHGQIGAGATGSTTSQVLHPKKSRLPRPRVNAGSTSQVPDPQKTQVPKPIAGSTSQVLHPKKSKLPKPIAGRPANPPSREPKKPECPPNVAKPRVIAGRTTNQRSTAGSSGSTQQPRSTASTSGPQHTTRAKTSSIAAGHRATSKRETQHKAKPVATSKRETQHKAKPVATSKRETQHKAKPPCPVVTPSVVDDGQAFQEKLKFYHAGAMEQDAHLTNPGKERKIGTLRGRIVELQLDYESDDVNTAACGEDPRDINTVIDEMTKRLHELQQQVLTKPEVMPMRGIPQRETKLVPCGVVAPSVYSPLTKSASSVPDFVAKLPIGKIVSLTRSRHVWNPLDLRKDLALMSEKKFNPAKFANRTRRPKGDPPPSIEPRSGSFREPKVLGKKPFQPKRTGYTTAEVRSGFQYRDKLARYHKHAVEDDSNLDESGLKLKLRNVRDNLASLHKNYPGREFNTTKKGIPPEELTTRMAAMARKLDELSQKMGTAFQTKLRAYRRGATDDDAHMSKPARDIKMKMIRSCIAELNTDYNDHVVHSKTFGQKTKTDYKTAIDEMKARLNKLARRTSKK